MNPRSREYGKKLRNAQNDVLAAVGVVQRRPSPSDGLPGSYKDRLDQLDLEDNFGDVLRLAFTILQGFTFWTRIVRDRILVRSTHFTREPVY
jgi:hypothetical protein